MKKRNVCIKLRFKLLTIKKLIRDTGTVWQAKKSNPVLYRDI